MDTDSRQSGGQFPASFPDTFKNFFSMLNEEEDTDVELYSNLLEDKVYKCAWKFLATARLQLKLCTKHARPQRTHIFHCRSFREPPNSDTANTAAPAVHRGARRPIKCGPARFGCSVPRTTRRVPTVFRSRPTPVATATNICATVACTRRALAVVTALVAAAAAVVVPPKQPLPPPPQHIRPQCVDAGPSTNSTLATTRNGENNLVN